MQKQKYKYEPGFFWSLYKFFQLLMNYINDVMLAYWDFIDSDISRIISSIVWLRRFVRGRFTKRGFFGRLLALFTVFLIFTVYPFMLFFFLLDNFLDFIIRYFFLPIDILFKKYLLKANLGKGNLLTLHSIYRGILLFKTFCLWIRSIASWFLRFFDKMRWIYRLIDYWNALDEFLYNMAIGIEYYIYFLINSFKSGLSFYYFLKWKFRYYVFTRSGHHSIKIRVKFKYRAIRTYVLKFYAYFKFILKWCFTFIKSLLYKTLILSKKYSIVSFWYSVWFVWQIFKYFIYGFVMLFIKLPLIIFKYFIHLPVWNKLKLLLIKIKYKK